MSKKKILTGSILLIVSLVALGTLGVSAYNSAKKAESPAAETVGSASAKTVKTEAYSLVLPEGMTTKDGDAGTVTLFLDGKEVGSITSIDYKNAEGLDMNALQNEETNPAVRAELNQLLALIVPEGKVDHMFNGYDRDGETHISLSVVPWPEKHEPEKTHDLLAKGDVFYDLSFQTGAIPEPEAKLLLDSFTLNP